MSLSPEEQKRYQRHTILPGFGIDAQLKLKSSSILVIGAGGLGCPALLYLAASGFGSIGIVDDDTVSESNLHRQVIFNSDDIGQNKAVTAKQKLSITNPFVRIETYPVKIDSANAIELIDSYDMVMDGSDNFSTRYLVNDACVMLNKPLISGSIFTFEGQVSVFNYQGGPTYRCIFPESPSAEDMPNCSEIGVLGVLPGVIGTIMATEAIKLATGIGEVLSGKLLIYNALTMDFSKIGFEGNSENKKITSLVQTAETCSVLKEIDAVRFNELKQSGESFQLIDVREKDEFEIFNICGENYPLSVLDKFVDKISRDKKVIIHCKSGGRSKKAIEKLELNYGFPNLYNLKNGLSDL